MTEREIIREGGYVKGFAGHSIHDLTGQLQWAMKRALGADKREYSIGAGDGAVTLKRRTGYNP